MEVQTTSMGPVILGVIIAIVVTAFVAFPLGIQWRKRVAEKEISSAEDEAKRLNRAELDRLRRAAGN